MAPAHRGKLQSHDMLSLQKPAPTIAAEVSWQCRHNNSRWPSQRSDRHLRRSLSWLARQMEQSRLRLLAEFESMRFPDRASCEAMPTGCQPRTPPQAAAPSRPHRLASLWGGLTSRTQSPFAQPAQQARPFDGDTPIYSSKASLAALSKVQQTPAVQVILVTLHLLSNPYSDVAHHNMSKEWPSCSSIYLSTHPPTGSLVYLPSFTHQSGNCVHPAHPASSCTHKKVLHSNCANSGASSRCAVLCSRATPRLGQK